jgi:hypothetical protein
MKKQFIWMIAAILVSGFTLTSCGDSDDDVTTGEEKTNDNVAAKAEVTYYVDLGANTLELADVEVTYLDENKKENTIKMTQKQWTLTRTLSASQLPADFSLKVSFEQKYDVIPEDDKDYEFGCVSRIPFKVYNNKGEKICDHPGVVTETDGSHPKMKGNQMSGWWLTYALGINPDKLLNFDKKTLTVKSDRAEFNDMDYKYPYISD